jgi:hypothetical protein
VDPFRDSVKFFSGAMFVALVAVVVATESLPPDIQSFIDARELCDHFRGEPWSVGDEPEIKARHDFIFENIKKYCTGTDRQLGELRSKYRENPEIVERLRHYEDHIESQ